MSAKIELKALNSKFPSVDGVLMDHEEIFPRATTEKDSLSVVRNASELVRQRLLLMTVELFGTSPNPGSTLQPQNIAQVIERSPADLDKHRAVARFLILQGERIAASGQSLEEPAADRLRSIRATFDETRTTLATVKSSGEYKLITAHMEKHQPQFTFHPVVPIETVNVPKPTPALPAAVAASVAAPPSPPPVASAPPPQPVTIAIGLDALPHAAPGDKGERTLSNAWSGAHGAFTTAAEGYMTLREQAKQRALQELGVRASRHTVSKRAQTLLGDPQELDECLQQRDHIHDIALQFAGEMARASGTRLQWERPVNPVLASRSVNILLNRLTPPDNVTLTPEFASTFAHTAELVNKTARGAIVPTQHVSRTEVLERLGQAMTQFQTSVFDQIPAARAVLLPDTMLGAGVDGILRTRSVAADHDTVIPNEFRHVERGLPRRLVEKPKRTDWSSNRDRR